MILLCIIFSRHKLATMYNIILQIQVIEKYPTLFFSFIAIAKNSISRSVGQNRAIKFRRNHLQYAGQTESSQIQGHPNPVAFSLQRAGRKVRVAACPTAGHTGQWGEGCFLLPGPHATGNLESRPMKTSMNSVIQRRVASP